jgi:hypothetical protein
MAPKPITGNTLFYGDNPPILRESIPTGFTYQTTRCGEMVRLPGPAIPNKMS